ncbi:MAG: DUF616 domain-containing protein [Alphaproteobacteria bacterium]|jgi:hypothetical protein|nr:DUF616 domain-containing protein [Alphaproteobacteria bacterium]
MKNQKLVIYSCMTGGYDDILPVPKDNNIDFVMFTDTPKDKLPKDSNWEFRQIDSTVARDSHFINRYYKVHPHKFLSDYEASIYIDSNIQIMNTDYIKDRHNELLGGKEIISIPKHPERKCVYEEISGVIINNKDKLGKVKNSLKFLIREGYPEKNGLFENGFTWRRHNNKKCIEVMNTWWKVLSDPNLSKRDQLSLVYSAWKHDLKIEMFWKDGKCCKTSDDFKWSKHPRKRKYRFKGRNKVLHELNIIMLQAQGLYLKLLKIFYKARFK